MKLKILSSISTCLLAFILVSFRGTGSRLTNYKSEMADYGFSDVAQRNVADGNKTDSEICTDVSLLSRNEIDEIDLSSISMNCDMQIYSLEFINIKSYGIILTDTMSYVRISGGHQEINEYTQVKLNKNTADALKKLVYDIYYKKGSAIKDNLPEPTVELKCSDDITWTIHGTIKGKTIREEFRISDVKETYQYVGVFPFYSEFQELRKLIYDIGEVMAYEFYDFNRFPYDAEHYNKLNLKGKYYDPESMQQGHL